MPTVAQGASATLSLGPNDAYKVSIPAGGYAQVGLLSGAPGSGSTELVLRDSRREVTVGPYGVNAVIRISAITGATTYGSPTTVPGDGISVVESWAAMQALTGVADGARCVVTTPIAPGMARNLRFVYESSAWRIDGLQDLEVDLTPASGTPGTTEQVLKSIGPLPAGFLLALRYVSFSVLAAKSGTTSSGTVRIRLGTSGTASDTLIASSGSLTAASRQLPVQHEGFAAGPTQWRFLLRGTSSGLLSAWTGAASNDAYPANVTVPNMQTGEVYLTFSMQMSDATDTPQIPNLIVRAG